MTRKSDVICECCHIACTLDHMYKFKTNTYVFTYEHLKQLDKKYILRLGYVYIANMLRSVAQWPTAIVSDGFSFEKSWMGSGLKPTSLLQRGLSECYLWVMIICRLFTMIWTHCFLNQTKIWHYIVIGFAIVGREIVTGTIWFTKFGDDMSHFSLTKEILHQSN